MKFRPVSASCSERGRPRRSHAATVFAAAAFWAILGSPVDAKLFHSQKEAVQLAFPNGERVEKKTYILTPEQIETFIADKDPQAYEKLLDRLLARMLNRAD